MDRMFLAALLCWVTACQPLSPTEPLEFYTTTTELSATGKPIHESEFLPPAAEGLHCHAPTITALLNGDLLAAWYCYPSAESELAGSAVYIARRDAQGWSEPTLFRDSPQGDGNPVLDSEADIVWLFQAVVPFGWSTAHVEVQLSRDAGTSWSDPEIIPGPLGTNVKYPPIRLADGQLLLPAYDDLLNRSQFFLGDDHWTQISVLSTGFVGQNIQPSVVQLHNGRLLVVMRDIGATALWLSYSDDSGFSWAAPQRTGFPNPAAPAQLLSLQSGNLLLIFNNDANDRRFLSAALSPDDGRSWTNPTLLIDAEGELAYPTAVQTADGLIHLVYSHDRTAIGYIRFNEAWICSQ